MRTARWNRFRRWLGLPPLPRPGQVWEIEYSGWNNTRKFAYYLLLRRGEDPMWPGQYLMSEFWHVFDLESGRFAHGSEDDRYTMHFEYDNGDKRMPYHRLLVEAP